jgi:phosphoribosylanthranilate isomerase
MTAVKICGITRVEDAEAAALFGANAVGFVLWRPSPRYASLETAQRIGAFLPPFVTRVGVFVNPSAGDISQAAASGIQLAQIHGDVPDWPGGRPPVPVIRAVHLGSDGAESIEPQVPDATILLDAHDPARHGGTGKTVDWKRAALVARLRRVVLAGGLTPANVAEAIGLVQPYAVDVASGVEASPGVKDHELMRQFIAAAKETV